MRKLREMFVAGLAVLCLAIPSVAHARQWRYRFTNGATDRFRETIDLVITERPNGFEVSGEYKTDVGLSCPIHGRYSRSTGELRARADCIIYDKEHEVVVNGSRIVKGRLQLSAPWAATATGEEIASAAERRRGTFIRIDSLTKVTNTHPSELAIDAAGQVAHFHNHSGATWRTEYTWEVPPILVAGDKASVRIGAFVSDVRPPQPISDSINLLAPDFAKQVIARYPDESSKSETYAVPIGAGYGDMKELKITVGFMSSSVVYTYRRQ